MNQLYSASQGINPFPIDHREVPVPDITEPGLVRLVTLPASACPCGRNYAHPHYMPCIHVRLARTAHPKIQNAGRGMLKDGTKVYVLDSIDTAYSTRVHGFHQGLWTHDLCFDGASWIVESCHIPSARTRTRIVNDPSRWTEHIPMNHS